MYICKFCHLRVSVYKAQAGCDTSYRQSRNFIYIYELIDLGNQIIPILAETLMGMGNYAIGYCCKMLHGIRVFIKNGSEICSTS